MTSLLGGNGGGNGGKADENGGKGDENEGGNGGMADEYGGMGVGMSISGGMGLEGMNLRNRFISMPNVVVGI